MKRDLDLTRKILEQVEEKSQGMGMVDLDIPGFTQDQISYHVMQLDQAGFLKAIDCSTMEGMDWKASSLTWDGHEFLDAIRNEAVWNKIKETVKDKGGSISFEVLKALALQLAGSVFGVGG